MFEQRESFPATDDLHLEATVNFHSLKGVSLTLYKIDIPA